VTSRSYTKAEMIADGAVHVLGVVLAVYGSIALVLLARRSRAGALIEIKGVAT
jgi:predicted membrane channel-forming protein YqfA (hemolysin III family)